MSDEGFRISTSQTALLESGIILSDISVKRVLLDEEESHLASLPDGLTKMTNPSADHFRKKRVRKLASHIATEVRLLSTRASSAGHDRAKVPIISLFCGAGGLDLGFEQAGFQTLLAVDSNRAAVETYNQNARAPVAICANISELSAETLVSLLQNCSPKLPRGVIGGPPCQGFSAGNVTSQAGDPRNRLPFTYARLIERLNKIAPLDFFVFENVTGLKRPKHAPRWKRIKTAFNRAGFRLFEHEVDALHFGLPQVRRRIFLVGINERIHPDVVFKFPIGSSRARRTLSEIILDLPEPTFFRRGLEPSEIPYHPNHWTMNPRSARFALGRFNRYRSFRQLSWDQPSPTVAYGNREIHVHPNGKRRLSIFEAMLIQGFPSKYVLSGTLGQQVTQISNAVPPPVARALARSIRDAIYSPSVVRLRHERAKI